MNLKITHVHAVAYDLTCIGTSCCDGVSPTCDVKYKSMGDECQKGYGRGLSDSHDTDVTNCRGLPEVIGITWCMCTENVQIVSLLHFKMGKKT